MRQKVSLLLVLSALLTFASAARAVPPPEHRPQICAMFFCAEVIAYSPLESAVMLRTSPGVSIAIQLEDGTTINFASREASPRDIANMSDADGIWSDGASPSAQMCVGCTEPHLPSHIIEATITGNVPDFRKHLRGSICIWTARYKHDLVRHDRAGIELGDRQCFDPPKDLPN